MAVLEIETEDEIYEVGFGQIQIEITGRCNMKCQHCRAANQPRQDMPVKQIAKIVRFARQSSESFREVVISGGEPLLHKELPRVLSCIRENGCEHATLTTNGALLTRQHLQLIEELHFRSFCLSVSIDSVNPKEHDAFRRHEGAFAKADAALRLVLGSRIPRLVTSMRSTILPSKIDLVEQIVRYAREVGCTQIGFSGVQPAGRATDRKDFLMSRKERILFLKKIHELSARYPDMKIGTNDPLKCLMCPQETTEGDDLVFDGCGAAATTFNVNADGVMTPCAMLDVPMMNVFPLSIEEMTASYQESSIVRDMITRNFKGKCGTCARKYQCGGCRVRALSSSGDFLETDPDCWIG
jgi:radical SAM protein with 4Fe4S-binding SPASM domain